MSDCRFGVSPVNYPDPDKTILILSNRQHALTKRYSCEIQLTTVINNWAKILGNNKVGRLPDPFFG